ncbi:hypothetical protein BU14_0180s0002 [Porphyra umbilicalis]|uniref:Peptidase S9 prolyl oligopeptidase catalytic domain-containing protein n=1 Tax=Porphyra umbilicalis TaxID=2786 RepID=A0A1X6P7C9_PORUM|nr:hypothetical protein BU14_0180s0002 [Porphyra umbilicalis]|eukprot:OSX76655.1 hypothetical protein BU14_0180s0002 [Porphyra umbilicalis]
MGGGLETGAGSTSSSAAGATSPGRSPSRSPSPPALEPPRSRSLLLVHCLGDENVAPAHTGALLDALTAAHVRGVQVLLFPGERHGLRGASAQMAFEAQALGVLRDALWPCERRRGMESGAAMEAGIEPRGGAGTAARVDAGMEPGGGVDSAARVDEEPAAVLAAGATRRVVGRQPAP